MIIAALDTTTRAGSLAIVRDGNVLEVLVGRASATHAERLPGDLLDLLRRRQLTPASVDVYGVAAGPGSFTGLRIGIATIQGLAFANLRPVVAVSALEAIAVTTFGASTLDRDNPLGVWMDAQRGEVFTAVYRRPGVAPEGSPSVYAPLAPEVELLDEASVASPEDTLDRWRDAPWMDSLRFVGDGAIGYRGVIAQQVGSDTLVLGPTPALAPAIGLMAERQARRGLAIAPHAIRPIYVRRPDAELTRDRRETR